MKKSIIIILTVISTFLAVFGYLYIPILSAFGVNFPARNILWALSIIPTVMIFQVPLIFCIIKLKKMIINKKEELNQFFLFDKKFSTQV